jgi:hypothetical protein
VPFSGLFGLGGNGAEGTQGPGRHGLGKLKPWLAAPRKDEMTIGATAFSWEKSRHTIKESFWQVYPLSLPVVHVHCPELVQGGLSSGSSDKGGKDNQITNGMRIGLA